MEQVKAAALNAIAKVTRAAIAQQQQAVELKARVREQKPVPPAEFEAQNHCRQGRGRKKRSKGSAKEPELRFSSQLLSVLQRVASANEKAHKQRSP
jgi:hypothetical protein